jgi:4-alpha-glucanotransferase
MVENGSIDGQAGGKTECPKHMDLTLACAVHRFLATTPSRILAVQLADVLGELDQVNVPGTVVEYPNWRRKLSYDLEDPEWARRFEYLAAAIRILRPG